MRYRKAAWILLVVVLAAGTGFASDIDQPRGVPHITAVEPSNGKAGDAVTAFGEYLDKSRVADLYLTNSKADIKVEIVRQDERSIQFKIPDEAAPGRYTLMVLMAGPEPKLLEEPATLTVQ